MPSFNLGRMQLWDAAADILTTFSSVYTSDRGPDGGHHRRARAPAAAAAGLRMP